MDSVASRLSSPEFAADGSASKRFLWDRFCAAHGIAERGVPLLATTADGLVEVFAYGRDGRQMLRRSAAMEAMLIEGVETVLAASPSNAEGLLYVMHRLDEAGQVVPLYIGKAGRHGRTGAAVSVNIASIRANTGRFARWGYNYAYHMGDLSAAALPGHAVAKVQPKYTRWARRLFDPESSLKPRPAMEARFWCTPWGPASPNIWREFGSCPLAFAEYLLIGVAGLLFPESPSGKFGFKLMALPPVVEA